jgi:hypothetical protein
VKFTQGFAGALKTRIVAQDTAANLATGTGTNGILGQTNAEGNYIYTNAKGGTSAVTNNSESGVLLNFGAGLPTAGIADWGTRLKAVFANLDPNATYYLSLYNLADINNEATAPTTTIGDGTVTDYAVQLGTQGAAGETVAFAAAAPGTIANKGVSNSLNGVNVVPLTVTKGAGEVIWEITNIKGSAADTFAFGVYAVYPQNKPPATSPATAATVALSYAPTNGSATTAPVGTTTTNIPRFSAVGAAQNFFTALPCQTTLLFPYVTNTGIAGSHWETGIAIENTGSDPLQTVGTSGSCQLNFYGANAPPMMTVPTSGTIAPGAGYTFVLSNPANAVPNPGYAAFTGYMFAICNFNYAHGFAFLSDPTNALSEGYLALVLNSQRAVSH